MSLYTHTYDFLSQLCDSAALVLILRFLEGGPGDDLIVPAMTYTASCSHYARLGATPVMVDTSSDTLDGLYDLLASYHFEKYKVIIIRELAGIVRL